MATSSACSGAGPVILREREKANGVHGHHGVPARNGVKVPYKHSSRSGESGAPMPMSFHRDQLQPSPQVRSDFGGGREHLVRGQDCVVDVAATDFPSAGQRPADRPEYRAAR
jgi:hypothetical protein